MITTETLPIVRLKRLTESLAELGITKKKIASITPIEQLNRSTLTDRQISQFRFLPKVEVLLVEGNNDLWFRSKEGDWASTFILLPNDMVVLTAEYVTGADIVVITHPAGMPEMNEAMAACAKREVEEESGIVLEKIIPLSTNGLSVSHRRSNERVFPFVGIPKIDDQGKVVMVPTRHDDNEDIIAFLMPLHDYWKFIAEHHYDNNVVGRDCAYAALRKLGRLELH